MSNITQILSVEHQNILRVLDAVLAKCDQIEKGETPNLAYFQKLISFIKNYADKFHHAKEEDILFTAMLENMENLHCNPIPVMLHEHDEGRNYVKGMEEGMQENNTEKIISYTCKYCVLMQQHIHKEDNILYPMAENALTSGQKELVNKKYREAEAKIKDEVNIDALLSFFITDVG